MCRTLSKALLTSMNSATERWSDSFAACMLAVSIVSGYVVNLRFVNPNWYIGIRYPIRPLIIFSNIFPSVGSGAEGVESGPIIFWEAIVCIWLFHCSGK